MDPARPPMIRKEPYIELYFKLNHEPPADWCLLFNEQVGKGAYSIKIKPETPDIIETWVRRSDEIESAFAHIKATLEQCIQLYLERLQAHRQAKQDEADGEVISAEQRQLNAVIDRLPFDQDDTD